MEIHQLILLGEIHENLRHFKYMSKRICITNHGGLVIECKASQIHFKFRGIPVSRNSPNSVEINQLFRLLHLPRNDFLSEIANPSFGTWLGVGAGPRGGPGEERGQAAPGLPEAGQGLHLSG